MSNKIEELLKKADQQALQKGIDITSSAYLKIREKLESKLLEMHPDEESILFSPDETEQSKKEKTEKFIKNKIKNTEKRFFDSISELEKELKKITSTFSNKIETEIVNVSNKIQEKIKNSNSKIHNKIKEVQKERQRVFHTKEIVRTLEKQKEIDLTETDSLKKDILKLQSDFTSLFEKVNSIPSTIEETKKIISHDTADEITKQWNILGMPNWRKLGMGLQAQIDALKTSGGSVSSVSNVDGTLTISPTTGAIIASISATYPGQTSITTLGTITTGKLSTGAIIGGVTMTLGSDASYDIYYRNSSGVLTRLANGTTGQVLTATTGAAPSWGAGGGGGLTVGTTTITGGTNGNIEYNNNGVLGELSTTGSGNVVLSTGATLSNPIVGTQSSSDNSTKAASTAYVTTAVANAIAGVNPAVAVQAATTAAGDTSGFTYNNGVSGVGATFTGSNNTAVTIDGFTFNALGQRLLVKNDTQSPSGAFNGIYYVTQLQTALLPPILTRALDFDSSSDINNTGAIPVVNGTVNGSTSWVVSSTVNTVGTDPITFTKFSINPTTIVTGVTTANGVSATFSGGLLTFTLGAITPTTVNGLTISTSTGTLTIANGKTATINNSITFAGTDSTTMTFPGSSDTVVTLAATQTLTNKRITLRMGTTASSATPTINTDNVNYYTITALAATITSFTTNLSGTPNDGDFLWIAITDNGTARGLTFGSSFEASGNVPLPTTTVISTRLDVLFVWNTVTSKWRCVSVS